MSNRRALLFDAYPHLYAGAQRTDQLLALGLPDFGWDLSIVTPADGPFTERLRRDGIEPRVLTPPPALSSYGRRTRRLKLVSAALAAPRYWLRLRRLILDEKPEVVHAVGQRGLVLAGIAARLARVPLVWHVQGLSGSRAFNLPASALATAVVVPAETVIGHMPGIGRFAPVTIIPNVADSRLDSAPVDDAERNGALVLCAARLHPDKGLDVLVDALPTVMTVHPDVTVRVIGGSQDGHEGLKRDLEDRAERRGVATAISFAGHVDDPGQHLRRAAVYVQPSRQRTEMLPLAILEAMAHGLPVIASDVGGVGELVQDGVTGRLIPADDPAALAAALIRLLDDPGEQRSMGIAGRKVAMRPRFRPEGLCAGFAGVYEAAVGVPRSRRSGPSGEGRRRVTE